MRMTERQKVNMLQMKCLRYIAAISRRDRIRDKVIRRRTGVQI